MSTSSFTSSVSTIAHCLQAAHQQYQTGHLAAAETLYRQVVQQDPQHMEALFWLALIADQQGRLEESVARYEQVLQVQPDSAEAEGNLGSVLLRLKRVPEAIAHHRRALERMPDNAKAHYNLALSLYDDGQIDAAIHHYQQAIAFQPDYANAHHNLGMALYRQDKLLEAISHYQQAVALDPNHVSARNSLGVALYKQDRLEEAIQHYRHAIDLKPDYISAYDNLGIALKQQKKYDEAAQVFRQAIQLRPNNANAYINLGNTLRDLGDLEAALIHIQEAVRLQPTNADAHNSYACLMVDLCRFDEAIASFEQAVQHRPDFADAHLNLGIILLQVGQFERGFSEYHWRWKTSQCPDLRYINAMWRGSDLTGKTILLTAEQGFGDTIQFARYAPLVAQFGGQVVIACQQPLLRLLATVPGVNRCANRDKDDVDVHAHAPLLELPYILGTTLATIPAQVPYLSPPPDAQINLQSFPGVRLKIGIVWAANPNNSTSSRRSCPLAQFLALLDTLPHIALYSLQKDAPEADQALLQGRDRLQDLQAQLNDFADTAAAIVQLDLILTVDTAVAHLAGALGKPTWTLLPYIADWRWLLDREDSPWYPTMRLFRQRQPGDWEEVFARVATALQSDAETLLAAILPAQQPAVRTVPQASTPSTRFVPNPAPQPITPPPARPPLPSSLLSPQASTIKPPTSSLALTGFNRIKQCRHGVFLHNIQDTGVGRSLDLYGEWSEGDVQLFQSLVKLGHTVVEVGAGIGAHTVMLAQLVGLQGKVVAIEPQRKVFQTLCANLALNSIANTYTYQIALGDRAGFVPIDQLRQTSATASSPTSLSLEATAQGQEQAQLATLDSFNLAQCHLLTLNVGHSLEAVLAGAQQTIQRCQPMIYVVCDRPAPDPTARAALMALGYTLYWHRPPLYNANNWLQHPINVFGSSTRHNWLGFHQNLRLTVNGMEPVT
jgi:FkbM family methyltransferase